ncbi:MAG TPA: ABC transporter permease [bacterium]
MLQQVALLAWKEALQLRRDWRTLAVIIVLPVLMLVLYGYAINFDLRHVALGVQDEDRTADARRLVDAFRRGESFEVVAWPGSQAEATRLLDAGEVRAVLVIPRGYAEDLAAGRTAIVQLLVDGADSTSATTSIGYAGAIVREHSGAVTVEALRRRGVSVRDGFPPLEARVRFWYNPEQKSVNYIVPGLIAVILMMVSTLLTALTVVRERERGTIEQLVVSPLRPAELIVGKLVPYAAIAFVDVLLVMGAGRLLFGVRVAGSIPLLLALSALYLVAALGIGLLISVVSPTQQTAMTAGILASQLPTILLSGFIFPVRAMPEVVQWLTNLVPARHYLVIVRGIFLKASPLPRLWPQALALAAIAAVTLALAALKFRKRL